MKKVSAVLICGFTVLNATSSFAHVVRAGSAASVIDFNATPNTQNAVTVSWTTTPQVSSEYFTIMRSSNGKDFTAWRTVQGPGQSMSMIDYLEIDDQPLGKVTFYRLVQVGAKGDSVYSEIRVVRSALVKNTTEVDVLPFTQQTNEEEGSVEVKNNNEVLLVMQDSKGHVFFAKGVFLMKENEISGVVLREIPAKGKYVVAASSREGVDGVTLVVR